VEEVISVFEIANTLGGSCEFILERCEPALNNNKELNQLIESAAQEIYPNLKIEWEPFGLGGEDFAHMTKQIPGSMFFLGCSQDDGLDRDLHTPIFDIDENCLSIGTAIFTATVNRFLNNE